MPKALPVAGISGKFILTEMTISPTIRYAVNGFGRIGTMNGRIGNREGDCMRYSSDKNYFFNGIVVVIGLCIVAGVTLLWSGIGSSEQGKGKENVVKATKGSVTPSVIIDELLSSSPISTTVENSLSLIKGVVAPTVPASIYILVEDGATIEVWQFSPDDDRWLKFHSVTRPVDKSDDVIIPTQEIERMQNYLESNSLPPEMPDNSLFKRYTTLVSAK